MGENLTCTANEFIRMGNEVVRRVAAGAKAGGRITVIDVYAACEKFLVETTTEEERAAGLKVDDKGTVAPQLAIRCVLLGQKYDSVSKGFGLKIMCDALHLNETGARIVTDEVLRWLKASGD